MAHYFYIVSEANDMVIDVAKPGGKDKDLLLNTAKGLKSQLWVWDIESRLVNKEGFVMDVKGKSKERGAHVHTWTPHNGMNQKWQVGSKRILSNMNDFAVDIKDWGKKSGPKKLVMSEASDDSISQKWIFVPEEVWEDFALMKAANNPLSKAEFWKMVADEYLHVIIGYSIKEYEQLVNEGISTLNKCADKLDEVSKDVGITKTTGGGAAIAGGAMVLGGLALAPFTAGLSLWLSGGGLVLGAAGALTSLIGSIVNSVWEGSEQEEIRKKISPAFRANRSLGDFLDQYVSMLKEAIEFLKTEKGKSIAQQAFEYLKAGKTGGNVAWGTYSLGNAVYSGTKAMKQARAIKTLVDFIEADWYALNGARVGLAGEVAAPGMRIFGRTLLTAGSTLSKAVSGSFAVVGIAFGIWDVIDGANKIAKGSTLGGEFRKTAKELKEQSDTLIKAFNGLQ